MTLEVEVENRSGWAIDPAAVRRVVADALLRERVEAGELPRPPPRGYAGCASTVPTSLRIASWRSSISPPSPSWS